MRIWMEKHVESLIIGFEYLGETSYLPFPLQGEKKELGLKYSMKEIKK